MAKKLTASPKVAKEGKWIEVKCAFCRGTGKDPFGLLSVLSTCGACGGKGTVSVKEPYLPCHACGGTGIQPFTRLRCLGCGGKRGENGREASGNLSPLPWNRHRWAAPLLPALFWHRSSHNSRNGGGNIAQG